jgi:hypothetical protein
MSFLRVCFHSIFLAASLKAADEKPFMSFYNPPAKPKQGSVLGSVLRTDPCSVGLRAVAQMGRNRHRGRLILAKSPPIELQEVRLC